MMIKINDWIRYEVSSNGDPAKEGDTLRASALKYIRLKNHGHSTNRGLKKLQKLAKNKTMEVVGIFTQFLQLAANGTAEYRGVLREQKDGRPATIEDLAEILPATANQIAFAVKCLSNPTVSWILVDKEGFQENQRSSEKTASLQEYNTTQFNSIQDNTIQLNAPEKERFVPPTVSQINEYCQEKNIYVNAEKFINSYGMKGWMVGKNKMKSWKMAVSNAVDWDCNRLKQPPPKPTEKDKIEKIKRDKQYARDEWEAYLRAKSTPALRDLLKDTKSRVYYFAGWLIKEILDEREGK